MLEENVSSIPQSVGVGMYCQNRTPFAQELRPTVDNWNIIKLKKKICSTKETIKWKRKLQNRRESLPVTYIQQRIDIQKIQRPQETKGQANKWPK